MRSKKSVTLLLLFGLIFTLLSTTSCNKNNEYNVNFSFPDARTNDLTIFLMNYALDGNRFHISGKDLTDLTDYISKEYLGGVGVTGTITINDNTIDFAPDFINQLTTTGFKSFSVPIKDITTVRTETFLYIGKTVVVTTKNHIEFKFHLSTSKRWYIPFATDDKDIVELIKKKMKRWKHL